MTPAQLAEIEARHSYVEKLGSVGSVRSMQEDRSVLLAEVRRLRLAMKRVRDITDGLCVMSIDPEPEICAGCGWPSPGEHAYDCGTRRRSPSGSDQ